MSEEEQDAIVGRTMRERREATERLELLRAEAKRRGERLEKAGHFLAAYPEYMVPEGKGVDRMFGGQPQTHKWLDTDIFPSDKIAELTEPLGRRLFPLLP